MAETSGTSGGRRTRSAAPEPEAEGGTATVVSAGRFDPTRDLIRLLWREAVEGRRGRSKHPKSALQEWAAGSRRKPPEYELVDRSGPDHSARFTVRVRVHNVGEAEATAACTGRAFMVLEMPSSSRACARSASRAISCAATSAASAAVRPRST